MAILRARKVDAIYALYMSPTSFQVNCNKTGDAPFSDTKAD